MVIVLVSIPNNNTLTQPTNNTILTQPANKQQDNVIYICNDTWQYIMEFLEFLDKIHIIKVNRDMYLNLKIYDLFDIRYQYIDLLTNEILKQNIYTKINKLCLANTNTAFNLNHLKQIKVLDISDTTLISGKDIEELNLTELYMRAIDTSFNLNHFKQLRVLNIAECELISDKDIEELNPEELDISYNHCIRNLNHMSNLKNLTARKSKIGHDGINKLKLKVIDITDSYLISSLFSEQSDIEIIDDNCYRDDLYEKNNNYYSDDDYDDMEDRYDNYCDDLTSFERNTGDYCSYDEYCSTRY